MIIAPDWLTGKVKTGNIKMTKCNLRKGRGTGGEKDMLGWIPDQVEDGFARLEPKALAERGVRVVLADMDNTLTRYGQPEPDDSVLRWRDDLQREGISLFVVSNSRRPHRARRFCEALAVPWIGRAGKPHRASFLLALERSGCQAEEAVMIGDQIFTDVWGAHNAGIRAIYLRPIALDTIWRRLRYWIEAPMRGLCRLRGGHI